MRDLGDGGGGLELLQSDQHVDMRAELLESRSSSASAIGKQTKYKNKAKAQFSPGGLRYNKGRNLQGAGVGNEEGLSPLEDQNIDSFNVNIAQKNIQKIQSSRKVRM